jgi:hypothetical protein
MLYPIELRARCVFQNKIYGFLVKHLFSEFPAIRSGRALLHRAGQYFNEVNMRKSILILILLATAAILAATDVSGVVEGTWSSANNPYNVVGDISVTGSLTIGPGCYISVQGAYTINVTGSINCNGNDPDSIVVDGGNGFWNGFRFEDCTVRSTFTHTIIHDTQGTNSYGIYVINSPVDIEYCHIENHDKALGYIALGVAQAPTCTLAHTRIEHCQQNGILVTEYSALLISSNDISDCGLGAQYRGAIQFSVQTNGALCLASIIDNHIHDNAKQGIILSDLNNVGTIYPSIIGNRIERNLTGIYFYNAEGFTYQNDINSNFIVGDANSGAGIMCYGPGSNPTVARNQIYGNYCGLYIINNGCANIGNLGNDSIEDDGNNFIHDNIDESGINHSVYANTNQTVYAQGNYWDYTTADEIAATITDVNDGSGTGAVNFQSFQTPVAPTFSSTPVTEAIAYQPYEYYVTVNNPMMIPLDFWIVDGPDWLNMTPFTPGAYLSGAPMSAGVFPVTLALSDGYHPPATQSFTLTVTRINHTPQFLSSPPVAELTVGDHYEYTVITQDTDGDPLSLTALLLPEWLTFESINDSTANITGVATAEGEYLMTLSVSDGIADPQLQTFIITVNPGTGTDDQSAIPRVTRMAGAYPNPFNPSTMLCFDVAAGDFAVVVVYDIRGRQVRDLGGFHAGSHHVVWNGCDDHGTQQAGGVYIMRMMAGGKAFVQKTLMLK